VAYLYLVDKKRNAVESDWKKLRAMLDTLRERYLVERNARVVGKLTDPNKTETERFWDALEMMEEEAKTLRRCLDGISRSKMWLRLIEMRAAGMLKPEDLSGFSEELQKQIFDEPY
jgi:hypothetical protein